MKNALLLLMISSLTITGFSQITFQKIYGGVLNSQGSCVRQTNDGGYIIVGNTASYGAGNKDVYLIKTNNYGDTLWSKTYGGINGDEGSEVQQTTDGGYIIVGVTASFGAGGNDVYLIKTDSIGDTLWSKTYGNTFYDAGTSIKQTTDGGYIIIGYTLNSSNYYSHVIIIKTNSIGDTMFTKILHVNNFDAGNSIEQTIDGGYIIVGYTGDNPPEHVYLIKLKPDMDTAWTKIYSGANMDFGNSVQQTTDGGYIIAGGTNSFGAGGNDIYLIKIDSIGDTLFTKTYGGTGDDEASSVKQTSDGGYIISGITNSFGSGGYDIYLVKTDSLGDTLWTRTFGGTGDDIAYSVQQTNDTGYIIVGYTYSFGGSYPKIYLIKTDSFGNVTQGCYQHNTETIVGSTTTQVGRPNTIVSSGAIVTSPQTIIGGGDMVTTICFTTGIDEVKTIDNVIVYPNPNNGNFEVVYSGLANHNSQFIIKDVLGRSVYTNNLINNTEGTQTIDVSGLNNGVYYWEMLTNKGIEGSGKIAVIK